MVCSHCGMPVESDGKICPECGQPFETVVEPERIRQKPQINVWTFVFGMVSIVLAILLVFSLTGVIRGAVHTGANELTLKTPEDAIAYFVEQLQEGDWEGALGACAVDETAEHYDYKLLLEKVEDSMPVIWCMPSEYAPYVAHNRCLVRLSLLRQMAYMTFSVTLPEEYADFVNMGQIAEGDIDFDDVVDDLDPGLAQNIRIVRIGETQELESDCVQSKYKTMADICGAEEMTSRTVLYEYNGEKYYGGFTLAEYDGGWRVTWLVDNLTGTPYSGALTEIGDEDAFDALLG